MTKIVIIGAGSHVFSRRLITDIVSYPELRDCIISLMDIVQEPLDLIAAYAQKLVKQHGFNTKIKSTTDRRKALSGADYVIVAIRVGGSQATKAEKEIPLKYGINQAIADTTGPGGVFYGSRHVAAILDICHDMEELCPDAWLLNYTNPMAIISWAVSDYSRLRTWAYATAYQIQPPNWPGTLAPLTQRCLTGWQGLTTWPGSWSLSGMKKMPILY